MTCGSKIAAHIDRFALKMLCIKYYKSTFLCKGVDYL